MIYVFKCNTCENVFEKILKIKDRDTQQTCDCGSSDTVRLLTAPTFLDENTEYGSPHKNATKKALERIHRETAGSTLNKTTDI